MLQNFCSPNVIVLMLSTEGRYSLRNTKACSEIRTFCCLSSLQVKITLEEGWFFFFFNICECNLYDAFCKSSKNPKSHF